MKMSIYYLTNLNNKSQLYEEIQHMNIEEIIRETLFHYDRLVYSIHTTILY